MNRKKLLWEVCKMGEKENRDPLGLTVAFIILVLLVAIFS